MQEMLYTQPTSCLSKLDKNGILLFLALDRRFESLKHEINKRTINEDKRVQYISWNNSIRE